MSFPLYIAPSDPLAVTQLSRFSLLLTSIFDRSHRTKPHAFHIAKRCAVLAAAALSRKQPK